MKDQNLGDMAVDLRNCAELLRENLASLNSCEAFKQDLVTSQLEQCASELERRSEGV